jgi:UDP-glucuronate 4-epimerase
MRILITGAAGFIGHFMVSRLLSEGYDIVGLDQINAYYNPQLKLDRLKQQGLETPSFSTAKSVMVPSEESKGELYVLSG